MKSDTGKIVTMIYAVPGIAITAASYISIAHAITGITRVLIIKAERKFFKHKNVKHCALKVFLIQVVFTCALTASLALLNTSKETENLRYLDAFYLNFVALTTIGFGDFHYKIEMYIDKPHFFLPHVMLLYVNFALVASTISSLSELGSETTCTITKAKIDIQPEINEGLE